MVCPKSDVSLFSRLKTFQISRGKRTVFYIVFLRCPSFAIVLLFFLLLFLFFISNTKTTTTTKKGKKGCQWGRLLVHHSKTRSFTPVVCRFLYLLYQFNRFLRPCSRSSLTEYLHLVPLEVTVIV